MNHKITKEWLHSFGDDDYEPSGLMTPRDRAELERRQAEQLRISLLYTFWSLCLNRFAISAAATFGLMGLVNSAPSSANSQKGHSKSGPRSHHSISHHSLPVGAGRVSDDHHPTLSGIGAHDAGSLDGSKGLSGASNVSSTGSVGTGTNVVRPRLSVDPSAQQRVEELVKSYLPRIHTPGIWVCATKHGQIVANCAEGLRVKDSNYLASPDDRVCIGSISKNFVGALAVIAIREGKISWSTPVISVFPEWKGKINPQYENVTVEQLMTHFAGIGPHVERIDVSKYSPTQARKLIALELLNAAPNSQPGTQFFYAPGASVVASMLEKIYGESFETLINEKISEPLGLNQLKMGSPANGVPFGSEPIGYQFDPQTGGEKQLNYNAPNYLDVGPAGGINCTISDLALFYSIWGATQGQNAMGRYLSEQEVQDGLSSPFGLGKTRAGFQSDAAGEAMMNAGQTCRGDYCLAFVRTHDDIVITIYVNEIPTSGTPDLCGLDMALLVAVRNW